MPANMDEALSEFQRVLEEAASTPGEEVVISCETIACIMTLAVGRPANISVMDTLHIRLIPQSVGIE